MKHPNRQQQVRLDILHPWCRQEIASFFERFCVVPIVEWGIFRGSANFSRSLGQPPADQV